MSTAVTPPAAAAAAADPLSQLRDLHAPPPIDWWPPAPGWWLLLAVVLGIAIGAGLWYRRRRQRNAYRRLAGQELDNVMRAEGATVAALNALLKRTALQAYGHSAVAHLHGADWVAFLRRQCPALNNRQALEALTSGPYEPGANQPATADLLAACRQWLDQHSLQLQAPPATTPLPGAATHADV